MAYSIQKLDIIHNQKCHFYKLLIDGKCQFDEFASKAEANSADRKSLVNIYSRMDSFDPDLKFLKKNSTTSKAGNTIEMTCSNSRKINFEFMSF